jgi:hypothetical protein
MRIYRIQRQNCRECLTTGSRKHRHTDHKGPSSSHPMQIHDAAGTYKISTYARTLLEDGNWCMRGATTKAQWIYIMVCIATADWDLSGRQPLDTPQESHIPDRCIDWVCHPYSAWFP